MSFFVSEDELDLELTLCSAQTFVWEKQDNSFLGAIRDFHYTLWREEDQLRFKVNQSFGRFDETRAEENLRHYFRLTKDDLEKLPKLSELRKDWEIEETRGIRVCRQEPFLCILSFICSQNNNQKRITKMVKFLESLGDRHGNYFKFPSPQQVLDAGECVLRENGFGYRAGYCISAANLCSNEFLQSLVEADYETRLQILQSIKGVGRKVADCISLFSLSEKLEEVPVDVHVFRYARENLEVTRKSKTLTKKTYDEVVQKFQTRYRRYPGWAQCYVFANYLKSIQKPL